MEIIEGLKIIDQYVKDKNLCAEHDQIWFGDYEESVNTMTIDEKTKLEKWGWFEDEEAWSHFT